MELKNQLQGGATNGEIHMAKKIKKNQLKAIVALLSIITAFLYWLLGLPIVSPLFLILAVYLIFFMK